MVHSKPRSVPADLIPHATCGSGEIVLAIDFARKDRCEVPSCEAPPKSLHPVGCCISRLAGDEVVSNARCDRRHTGFVICPSN